MFRFDAFRRPEAAPDAEDSQRSGDKSVNFLQRMASADSILRASPIMKRPSFSSLHNSFSSSSTTTQSTSQSSFSIPVPANSWGMLTWSRLRDADDAEFDDIVDLLLTPEKAILLLPVSQPSHPSALIDREFIQDHVIVYQSNHDMSQVLSLSGIRGMFLNDQLVALGLLPSEREVASIVSGSPNKRSLFDTFNLDPASITDDYPRYNILASHVQLPLRNDRMITVMLIQKPISKSEVIEWQKSRDKQSLSAAYYLAEQDPLMPRVKEFIQNFCRRPPRNLDQASTMILDFLEDLSSAAQDTGSVDDRLDAVESYICYELYDRLFPTAGSDEALADEALESRIAALNLLDLDLKHLGVIVEDQEEVDEINQVVKTAGTQLQQLNSMASAKEKLEGVVKTHQVIVDAIEGFADKYRKATLDADSEVVQEIRHAMTAVNEDEKESLLKENDHPNKGNTVLSDKKLPSLPSDERADHQTLRTASADVLLPLLIFTIVRSNPTNFLSNMRFIQRFRRPSRISGSKSYCLTNMMAAVSFLETTNLVGLGLSADRVLSNTTDLAGPPTPPKPVPSRRQSQGDTATTGGGLKLMSDVMDSSYKVFDGLGRLWQRGQTDVGKMSLPMVSSSNNKPPSSSSSSSIVDEMIGNNSHRGRAASVTESELNVLRPNKSSNDNWDNAAAARLLESKNGRSRTDAFQTLLQAPSHFIQSVSKSNQIATEGPLQKFLDKKSVDDLKIGEVAELLADYKRLAAIMKQAGLC